MRNTGMLLLLGIGFFAAGCTSHSAIQLERNYVASYQEVFERIPQEAPKCEMKVESSDPESGVMILNAHRTADKVLTGSLLNIVQGDEVIVKVKRVEPMVTNVWVDSKARGQIFVDFGRTNRNVEALIKVLDEVWTVADDERGEKRETEGS